MFIINIFNRADQAQWGTLSVGEKEREREREREGERVCVIGKKGKIENR